MTPEQERIIEEIVTEYKKKFWNDEANLRAWILKQSIQRGEQEDWLRTALDRMAEIAVAQDRERIREWAMENRRVWNKGMEHADLVTEYNDCLDDLLNFLSPNQK